MELVTNVHENLLLDEKTEEKTHSVTIDFKMVAFSLAGKDYAIDIMSVKEIAKAGRFTFVPNTSPFVLGVYNLRGDIIPIIDLRVFFNIPVTERKGNEIENMIIVTVNERTFGVVVDAIDKVVGIQKSTIQPPHPLFGDINIKYIYGVVESTDRLYILLDIARIFAPKTVPQNEKEKESQVVAEEGLPVPPEPVEMPASKIVSQPQPVKKTPPVQQKTQPEPQAAARPREVPVPQSDKTPLASPSSVVDAPAAAMPQKTPAPAENVDYTFITESLQNFKKFYTSPVNQNWIKRRFAEWTKLRGAANTQLVAASDADEFLDGFYSPYTGKFWTEAYAQAVYKTLPDNTAKQIFVWNPGCGKGYETYSLACILKKRYPDSRVRIYAHDTDLVNISNAPLLSVPVEATGSWYAPFLTESVSGAYSFTQEIKDMVLFEYHDCLNTNNMSGIDIIFCRDMLSFLPVDSQESLLEEFRDKLKGNGIMMLGENEGVAAHNNWEEKMVGNIMVYSK